MLDFGGYGDRQRRIWPFVIAQRRTSVPSALHQARSNVVENEYAERVGA
jgi:hypothetical protein